MARYKSCLLTYLLLKICFQVRVTCYFLQTWPLVYGQPGPDCSQNWVRFLLFNDKIIRPEVVILQLFCRSRRSLFKKRIMLAPAWATRTGTIYRQRKETN